MNIKLQWTEYDYYHQSKCGYRVSKCGGVYTAWTNLKTGKREIIRSGLSDVDAAKASCELHKLQVNYD